MVAKDASGALRFARNGELCVSADGSLALADGTPIEPRITVPHDTLDRSIDSSGRAWVARASVPDTSVEVGRIVLSRFPSPQFVASVSATSFAATAASGEPILCEPGQHGVGVLRQRYLENSNASQLREVEALREVDERLVALYARLNAASKSVNSKVERAKRAPLVASATGIDSAMRFCSTSGTSISIPQPRDLPTRVTDAPGPNSTLPTGRAIR